MERLVTVVDAATRASADVRIDAAGTLGDALPALMHLTGASSPAMSRVGEPLDPRQPAAHLRDGDVLLLGAPAAQRAAPAVTVDVTAGPDAGRRLPLAPGRYVLGRDGSCFAADDPAVSRRHAEVSVSSDGSVKVTDLDSSNGTVLDKEQLPAGQPVQWMAGVELQVGATRLVHGRRDAAASTSPGPAGTTTVNRPPRLRPPTDPATIEFPALPQPATTGRLPILASVAPLLAGVVLAAVMHRWEFLAFALMSPLVVLGQAVADRWSARRSNRRAAAEHAAAVAAAEQQLDEALAAEATARLRAAPDLATLVAAAVDRTCALWHRGRDDDALTLRLGLGSLPPTLHVSGGPSAPHLTDVPVCLDLLRHRVTGLCGGARATDLARSLLVQAATLAGPADLQITVLAPGRAAQWAWARWLPKARIALTTAQLRQRLDELAAGDAGERHLVVADNVTDAGIAAVLADLPTTSVVWVGTTPLTLPASCETVVTVTGGARQVLSVRAHDMTVDDVCPDLVPLDIAEAVSRALAPLRDVAAAATVPSLVSWSHLYDVPLAADAAAAAASLCRRWSSGPLTSVCLGLSADGPVFIDLQKDGPHVLVAGTTGAGKSELLQTLVASLVAANSPSDLNLLLVDFKGGAAFGPCGGLPHTVGVLTDLDAAATSRAITSLTAELRRRERVLAAAAVADIDTWRARGCHQEPGAEPLPRLVIVVDEFATLADELPDFVGGLVGIAQRGRSLGIHLVLATQRPEGAVSADIRANTRLRICLAVARENESRDVIDSPRAMTISRSTPGRALVRVGANELVEVQTARVAGPATTANHRRGQVEIVPVLAWDDDDPTPPATTTTTELDQLVEAAVVAAQQTSARIAAPPWLPPLPADVVLSRLLTADDGAAVGLVDLPDRQAQPALTLAPDCAEPWLIVGGARSGRSTAVLTMATALAAAQSPQQLHMWAVDCGHALAPLAELPHTGAVVDVRDIERVDRLLTFLAAEVEGRRTGTASDDHALLLVVDGWDGLVAATTDADSGHCQELLLRLLAHGPGAGLRVIVTSDRSGLTGRLSASVSNRICLRLPDPSDYALVGLPVRHVPTVLPPGRGIRAADLALVQFATADEAATGRARAWPAPVHPPRRFEPMPTRVPLHSLGASSGLILGLGGDDLRPVVVDPDEAGGVFLVAGPPRSGRSTALVSIAAQLQDRPVVAMCARRGPLRQRRDLALVADPARTEDVRAAFAAVADGATLLVDDIDLVEAASVLDGIEAAVRSARDGGGFVVLAGTTETMSASFRGPVAQARRARTGLLLRPEGPHDGELLGVRLRRRGGHTDPPGRGVLAINGRVVRVQVPDPA
jgi:S-DNA-T family DNA segregation ATPase FtsK/SpoIIIE